MVTLAELNKKKYQTDSIVSSNLLTLRRRLNQIEELWEAMGNPPFLCTSGLRSEDQQKAMIAAGKSKATRSRHLLGAAADILDPDDKIKEWLKANPKILEDANLWCEHWESTPGWCHFQIIPPNSGNRWFKP